MPIPEKIDIANQKYCDKLKDMTGDSGYEVSKKSLQRMKSGGVAPGASPAPDPAPAGPAGAAGAHDLRRAAPGHPPAGGAGAV